MYKYQKETMKEIFKAMSKIEEMTEEVYTINIGYGENEIWDGSEYVTHKGDLLVRTNKNSKFAIKEDMHWGTFQHPISDSWYEDIEKVKIDNNVFLKLNKLINKVLTDNQKREKFYEKLNAQLKALNEAMEE